MPVPALNVPLFEMPPLKFICELTVLLFQIPDAEMVTSPVKVFVPVALVKLIVPFNDVEPLTVRLKPLTVKVDPEVTEMLVHADAASTVTVNPPSTKTLSPATGTLAPGTPPEVADQVEVAFQFPVATE